MILLHFFNLVAFGLTCYPSPYPILPHHIELMEMNTYATHDQCNFTLIVPKKVINPYKEHIQNFVQQKPFGSFCLRCTACLAVAAQIASTIENTMRNCRIEEKSQDSTNDQLSEEINSLCTNGFKNYDLRKYNENNLVTNKLKCTQHINSNMDGNWTKKLRELCNLYTSYMDLKYISNNYVNESQEFSRQLCSGTGIFRDCQNMNLEESTEIPQDLNC